MRCQGHVGFVGHSVDPCGTALHVLTFLSLLRELRLGHGTLSSRVGYPRNSCNTCLDRCRIYRNPAGQRFSGCCTARLLITGGFLQVCPVDGSQGYKEPSSRRAPHTLQHLTMGDRFIFQGLYIIHLHCSRLYDECWNRPYPGTTSPRRRSKALPRRARHWGQPHLSRASTQL
jgi:hypothetical protein